MMEKIDLHMHSYFSDGTLDCKSLLAEIVEKDIKMFSLTDHDTIDGLDEMLHVTKDSDVEFIPGVELATTYLGKEFHLTTYGYDPHNEAFNEMLKENQKIRKDFDVEIIKYIERDPKIEVSLVDFLTYVDEPYQGGWPSINYLKSLEIIKSLGDFFELLSDFSLDMTFPSPDVIIKKAHDAGAAVFLAHPSSNQRGGLDVNVLDDFKNFGVDGLECYSPYNKSEEEATRYVMYCQLNGLKISGGSDYHGAFVNRFLGNPEISSDMISYDFFKSLCYKK